MSKYAVGDEIPFVFDTAPNVTGMTDVLMAGVNLNTDVDLALPGGELFSSASGLAFAATESATSPGTYSHIIRNLPIGSYLIWAASATNGAESNKVLVTVGASSSGDRFYGQAQA